MTLIVCRTEQWRKEQDCSDDAAQIQMQKRMKCFIYQFNELTINCCLQSSDKCVNFAPVVLITSMILPDFVFIMNIKDLTSVYFIMVDGFWETSLLNKTAFFQHVRDGIYVPLSFIILCFYLASSLHVAFKCAR